MFPMWTRAFRVVMVYYNSLQSSYNPDKIGYSVFQIAFCSSIFALCVLNIGVLYHGSLLWSSNRYRSEDPTYSRFVSWKRPLVGSFFSLCSLLIAWHVITIA
jgi:hypothetical protein